MYLKKFQDKQRCLKKKKNNNPVSMNHGEISRTIGMWSFKIILKYTY